MNLHIDNDTCHEIIFTQGGVSHSLDKLYYNEHLVWEKQSQHDYSQDYFTIESLEDNNDITLVREDLGGAPPSITFYYSTDNGTTWSTYNTQASKLWVLNSGDRLLIKATTSYWATSNVSNWHFIGSKTHKVYGNIMSLIYGDNFVGQTTLNTVTSGSTICNVLGYIFSDDTKITEAHNLILPATTLAKASYLRMFYGCTLLVTTPSLPATTLAEFCYEGMFQGCTSLTESPILPAQTLKSNCYQYMFVGCTSLKKITCLATNISATYCTDNWVYNVAATGEFYKAASMSSWTTGTSGIPSGWTVTDYTS